jgi:hypothetical protein
MPPPEKTSPLALDYQVANIPFRQRLNIYGNSLGKGIITNLSGLFQGIGATEIEIADSDFVSGNSGSPVVSSGSRKIIGIATYIEKLTKSDWTVKGTRFDPDSITSEPRRFATRIDNIKVEDIEPLNPLKQDEDLCIIRQMDAVLASLVLKATTSSTASFKELLKEKYLDLESSGAFTHKWGSVYMRNKYDKASGFINALAEILKIDFSGKKSFAVSDAAYGYYKERLYSDGKNVIDLGEALNDFKKSGEYRKKVLAIFPENRDEFKVMNVDVFQVIDSRNILARVNGIQHIKFLIDHKLYDGQMAYTLVIMRKGVHSYRTSFGSQKTVPSYVALIPATDEQMKEYLNDGRERKRVYVPTQYKICRLCNGKGYITKEKRRGQMMAEREECPLCHGKGKIKVKDAHYVYE